MIQIVFATEKQVETLEVDLENSRAAHHHGAGIQDDVEENSMGHRGMAYISSSQCFLRRVKSKIAKYQLGF